MFLHSNSAVEVGEGRQELPHFIAAWIIFVICQKVGQIPKYKNSSGPEQNGRWRKNGIRKQSCDWATRPRMPLPCPKLTHLRVLGPQGPLASCCHYFALLSWPQSQGRGHPRGERGWFCRNKSEISSSHLLRFIKLFHPTPQNVCVCCGLEIPKVPVSFFVLHVAQIFWQTLSEGWVFLYVCEYI